MVPIPQLFRYFGSKARMMSTITSVVPPMTDVLISLFTGSGVFEYNYALAHPQCKVICYDIDPSVVNFHQQALKDRVALHASIMAAHKRACEGGLTLTLERFKRLLNTHRVAVRRGGDRVTGQAAATRFYLLTAYSFNGKFGSYAAKHALKVPTGLLHDLPTNIQVRLGDALEVLQSIVARKQSKGTCLYLDPPYMFNYWSRDYYTTSTAGFDHASMAALLLQVDAKGAPWILSYNDTPDVRKMYDERSWTRLTLPIGYSYYNRELKDRTSPLYIVAKKAELLVTNQTLTPQQRKYTRSLFTHGQTQRFGAH